jgi:uncharacterized protein (TIGR02588 family)
VLATLGYLFYDSFATSAALPPRIEVQLGTPEQQSNRFIVPVSVTNHGDQTAQGVTVEVVLENDGKEEESGEFTVQFLPRHSTRKGWVPFKTDPRQAEKIDAGILGYNTP